MTSSLKNYLPIEFGRIAAQSAKQVIFQKVRDAERDRQYDEFKDKIDEVISESSRGSNTEMSLLTLAETKQLLDEMNYFLEKALGVATES